MTKREMATDIDKLAQHMRGVAYDMGYYAGFDVEWLRHQVELEGAANIAAQWAAEIREEDDEGEEA
jgi:hypothetical protein